MNDLREEGAFQAFVRDKRGLWLKLAYRILRDRHEAEDVVQETLAALWEKRERLLIEDPGAYTARAVWLNAIRKRERTRSHLSLEEAAEPAAPEKQPPEIWESMDPVLLERSLQKLPEAQRTVVRMKYYAGLSFREIGEALKISLNTAASRCRYALETLRETLESGLHPPKR